MFWKRKKTLNYKELVKINKKRKVFKDFHLNLIWPEKFDAIEKFYEKIIKFFIKIVSTIFIRVRDENEGEKKKNVINTVYKDFSSRQYNFIWLSTAFYLLISFVPVIYVVFLLNNLTVSITPFIGLSSSKFQESFGSIILGRFMPGSVKYLIGIQDFQENSNVASYATLIPKLLLLGSALYISSEGYAKLISSCNFIYDHKKIGTFIGNKLKGFFLVLFVSVLLWFFSTFHILVDALMAKNIFDKDSSVFSIVREVHFIMMSFIFFVILFIGLFQLAPSFKQKMNSVYRGAIISALPITILAIIFSSINKLFSYDKFGGAVGFFLTIAFFINLFTYFMFLGITFNKAYYSNFISGRTISKKSFFYYF
ncbi:YihY/virulence factor BrkB family protein [Mycoplasmopsis gallinacea]|uniref:YihY/virulence factor BrkB family protein n=1 Tax=Mycoplasmopsis gallinacea TaxID=29556 RepID=A0A0D5ZK99_9BACT|nr:YhjD/YihY/BrkB family envelope integrity protein [Mycoplasmopsis gallinacea]AKA50070.1 hypothetical protein VO56_02330 [Mycoplasmopsis gallinacea]QIW62122.1 YihY/virulence factor BrkB family protein [Mycoplasmopsis gallinacea]